MSNQDKMLNIYTKNIEELFDKYKDNEYMTNRLTYHITNVLPNTLENELKNHEKRIARNDYLMNEQQLFIQVFLNQNQYYYISNNGYFFQYNGTNYVIISEDVIHHHILTSISKDRKLMAWKHKTKVTLLKLIKERNLFKSIPETSTIQLVLNKLYPTFFSTKNKAKYFLTLIGDNILKKNIDLIFIINPKHKKSLTDLDTISYLTTGHSNITNNIVSKYHENYNTTTCRLLDMNEHSNELWRDLLNACGINLLCVAAHYSNRYKNSELFIESCDDISDYVLYFKRNTGEQMFESFCQQYIEITDTNVSSSISWKNLHYIWKTFLSKKGFPNNIIYSNKLKTLFKDKYPYDESNDSFINITSIYLPRVSFFISFWETQIQYIENDKGFDHEMEIDEICGLFKLWIQEKQNNINNIEEQDIVNIINHYFPTIEISDNKYIMNITCYSWNKIDEMNKSLFDAKIYYKKIISDGLDDKVIISFNDLYTFYINNNTSKLAINKLYFEKYLCYKLSDYIHIDNFISIDWLEK